MLLGSLPGQREPRGPPVLPEVQVQALVQAEHRIRQLVGEQLGQRAKGSWASLGSWRGADVERWLEWMLPQVQAAQAGMALVAATTMTRILELDPVVPQDWSRARGVEPEEVYRRPAKQMYGMLAQGKPFDDALSASVARVGDLVATDLQLAYRGQAGSVISNSGVVQEYRRTLSGKAKHCALCLIASTQRYHSNLLMPVHPGCSCGIEPLVPGAHSQILDRDRLDEAQRQMEDLGLNSGSDRRELANSILVEEHGEYGPTLTWEQHRFTGPGQVTSA